MMSPGVLAGRCGHKGQALLECLLVMVPLVSIWLAIAWLGGMQQRVVATGMAVRQAAFMHAAGQDWPAGVAAGSPVTLSKSERRLPGSAQAGSETDGMVGLRAEYGVEGGGLMRIQGTARVPAPPRWFASSRAGLASTAEWQVPGHLALLAGAGGGMGDAEVQQRIEQADSAWRTVAERSLASARRLDHVMRRVDVPWRPGHEASAWLQDWAGDVPAAYLAPSGRAYEP